MEQIITLLGKTEKDIEYVTDRLGHDRRYAIDAEKMKNEFDWDRSIRLSKGYKKRCNGMRRMRNGGNH